MNLKKQEPEKSYDQPSYHINKVLLFIILYKIITSKIFFLLFAGLYYSCITCYFINFFLKENAL